MTQTTDTEKAPVTVSILEKEYSILCHSNEVHSLKKSAALLNEKMRTARNSGKMFGMERLAIMVALNLCHDLVLLQGEKENSEQNLRDEFQSLILRIEEAL